MIQRVRVSILVLLLTAVPLLGQTLPRAQPQQVGISALGLERLQATLHEYVGEGKISGGVTWLARGGKVFFSEAYGLQDIESQVPMSEGSIFRIASQSKALTSVAIMMLQEEGKLLISDPLSRHLPEFADVTVAEVSESGDTTLVSARSPITLRHLLTHTSGLGYGGGISGAWWREAGITGWYFADREEGIRETVRRMGALPLLSHPGAEYHYGYSIDVLGAVIEEVSGQSFSDFLAERILGPLGMVDTHFYLPPEKASRLTTVYSASPAGLQRSPDPGGMIGQGAYLDGPRMSFSGGAGLLSTAEDYGRFLQMLLNGGTLDGARILSPKSVQLMTTDHVGDRSPFLPASGFGLGFSVLQDVGLSGELGSVGTYGWGGAYHSVYWVDPVEDLVVVYMVQLSPTGGLDDVAKLRTLVYAAITESYGRE